TITSSNRVTVFLGNGNGTFQVLPQTFDAGGKRPLSIAAADIDGDGKLDLVVANYGDPNIIPPDPGNVAVLLGNGHGTFRAPLPFIVGTNPESVVVGEFHGDGKLDLAVANFDEKNFGPGTVSVLLNTTSAPAPPNYTLSASPSSVAVTQGSSGSSTITVSPQNGFTGSVTLSPSKLRSASTAAIDPNPTTTSSTLTLTASPTATTGTVSVTVTGASGTLTPKTTTLNLPAAAAPTYTLSASPSSLTVTQGSSGSSTITVSPQNGFTGSVTLSPSTLPSGVTAAFSPNPTATTKTRRPTSRDTATTATVTLNISGT